MVLPAANEVSHGYQRILIIADDIDIIVLGISFFGDIGADKLESKLRNISIHDICSTISSDKANCYPAFHALTGSDNIHPSFLARERNLLTQNGARGQSSQPRFVI